MKKQMLRKKANGEPARGDTCFYCGKEYHPMNVWTKDGEKMWVCSMEWRYDKDGFNIWEVEECSNKAKADGFLFRPDQTPTR